MPKPTVIWLIFQTKKLEGNDRFEGFAIDLMTEIAKFLQFNISFKLVDDGMVSWIILYKKRKNLYLNNLCKLMFSSESVNPAEGAGYFLVL